MCLGKKNLTGLKEREEDSGKGKEERKKEKTKRKKERKKESDSREKHLRARKYYVLSSSIAILMHNKYYTIVVG